MTNADEELRQLQQQVARRDKLKETLEDLKTQQQDLALQERQLAVQVQREAEDVRQLEKQTMTALFYSILGKRAEKMEKERREARSAVVEHEEAARRLEEVQREIRRASDELEGLVGCGQRYQRALFQKTEALKASGGAGSPRIAELESSIAALEEDQRQIYEALQAGRDALELALDIQREMSRAENWCIADLLGVGVLADLNKYDHINAAQAQLERLQGKLRCFRTELADVCAIAPSLSIEISGFLRLADYLFDNWLTNTAVADIVVQAAQQVDDAVEQISDALDRLEALCREGGQRIETQKQALEHYVLNA